MKAIDHTFCGFIGMITLLWCWENAQNAFGSWFTSFSHVLPTSRVGYHTVKPIESLVYCLSIPVSMINSSIPFDSLIFTFQYLNNFLVQVWLNSVLSFRQKFIICARWMVIHYQLSTKECIILLQGISIQFAGILLVKAVVTRGSFTKVDIKFVNVIWGRFPRWMFMVKWLSTVEKLMMLLTLGA